jgi:hypothetical protein
LEKPFSKDSLMTDEQQSKELNKLLIQNLNNQLQNNVPPEINKTLKRLRKEGCSKKNAINLIKCALSIEIFGAIKGDEYNEERYIENLKALPTLPFEQDKAAAAAKEQEEAQV